MAEIQPQFPNPAPYEAHPYEDELHKFIPTSHILSGSSGHVYLGQYYERSNPNEPFQLHTSALKYYPFADSTAFESTVADVTDNNHAHLKERIWFGSLRESKYLREIGPHPNIVPLWSTAIDFDRQVVINAFPYFKQGSLAGYAKQPLSVRQKAEWMQQVAAGLEYVHQRGFVHRDVKLGNILLTDAGIAILMDFDPATRILSQSDVERQEKRKIIGSPWYMAPEQFNEYGATKKSDLYALGVSTYYLMSGELPFNGSYQELEIQHKTKQPPRFHEQGDGYGFVPEELQAVEPIIMQALAKNPDARQDSVSAFAKALDEALDAVEQRQSAVRPIMQLGVAAIFKNDHALALDHFASAIKLDPENISARYLCYVVQQTTPNAERAAEMLQSIDTYIARNSDELVMKAQAALSLQKPREAYAYCSAARARGCQNPTQAEALMAEAERRMVRAERPWRRLGNAAMQLVRQRAIKKAANRRV